MNRELMEILNLMSEHTYKTAVQFAESVLVHEKTVRTRLKELNKVLAQNGATIISKRKCGYRLMVHDLELYTSFCDSLKERNEQMPPSNSQERVNYIFEYLLKHSDYVKVDFFVEVLYVSRNTITAEIKKVEYIFNRYHIELVRRPNYGIKVVGSEFDKRICMANYYLKVNGLDRSNKKIHEDQHQVSLILQSVLSRNFIRISEIAFQALTMGLYFGIKRVQGGHFAKMDEFENDLSQEGKRVEINQRMIKVAAFVAAEVETHFSMQLSSDEVCYIAVLLGGTASSDIDLHISQNLEINHFIDDLSKRMILRVCEGFKLDFLDDFDLRMSLNKHMVPFHIRMSYKIPLKNPILENVKKEYPYAYNLAAHAVTVLNEYYRVRIPEEETGYFALLFQFALEKREKKIQKKNILVVCASGVGSAQLFVHRYRQTFGKYLDQIQECTVLEAASYDYSEIDYLFTTVPLDVAVPVPVFMVSLFGDDEDLYTVHKLFKRGDKKVLERFFAPEYFYSDIALKSREEVIHFLCDAAAKHFDLPENFFDAIMKREMLGQTDFGNLAAIPHPFSIMTEESFVLVGILKEPINWGHNDVQIVFLVSISKVGDKDIEMFYQLITKLLFDTEKLKQLIARPEFSHLIELLQDSGE